jgi:hypothetical protein
MTMGPIITHRLPPLKGAEQELRDSLAAIFASGDSPTMQAKIDAIVLLFRKHDADAVNALMAHVKEYLW